MCLVYTSCDIDTLACVFTAANARKSSLTCSRRFSTRKTADSRHRKGFKCIDRLTTGIFISRDVVFVSFALTPFKLEIEKYRRLEQLFVFRNQKPLRERRPNRKNWFTWHHRAPNFITKSLFSSSIQGVSGLSMHLSAISRYFSMKIRNVAALRTEIPVTKPLQKPENKEMNSSKHFNGEHTTQGVASRAERVLEFLLLIIYAAEILDRREFPKRVSNATSGPDSRGRHFGNPIRSMRLQSEHFCPRKLIRRIEVNNCSRQANTRRVSQCLLMKHLLLSAACRT